MHDPQPAQGEKVAPWGTACRGIGLFCGFPLLFMLCGAGLFVAGVLLERAGLSPAALLPAGTSSRAATALAAVIVVVCWAALFIGSAALAGWFSMRQKPGADEPPVNQ
jgi:hypothetical protein